MKQQTLADAIGIARPSLSAIEKDKAWPRPDTLDGLMHELDLTLSEIFVAGPSDRTPRFIDESPDADYRLDLGRDLRKGREKDGLSLFQVAERCGLSVAQLSRIERGEVRRTRAYEEEPDDAELPREFRRIRFRYAELQRLYMLSRLKQPSTKEAGFAFG